MEQSSAGFEAGDISDHGGIIRRQVEVRENQFHFFTVTGGFQAGTQLPVAGDAPGDGKGAVTGGAQGFQRLVNQDVRHGPLERSAEVAQSLPGQWTITSPRKSIFPMDKSTSPLTS